MEADAEPRTHPTVVGVMLDGEPLDGAMVTHDQLVGEHRLTFSLAK